MLEAYAVEGGLGSSADGHSITATQKGLREGEPDTGGAAGDEDDSLCIDDASP